MIAGIFHKGSGIGNQLHRYIATRVLALDKGYEWGMVAPELCKVKDFMNLDMGVEVNIPYTTEENSGKVLPYSTPEFLCDRFTNLWEEKTNYYNPEFNFIEDNTIIDGEFQDRRYFERRMHEINNQWLVTEPLKMAEDVCVVGFRGGEFYVFPELGLPKSYFDEAIARMRRFNPDMRFEVHTDDEVLAKEFFPDFPIIHDASINWRSMRYAKFAIISNSSFYIFPRVLAHYVRPYGSLTVAPRYWARRNVAQEWSMPQNYYPEFEYA